MKRTADLMRRLALADPADPADPAHPAHPAHPAKNPTGETSNVNSSTAQALLHRIQSDPVDSQSAAGSRTRRPSQHGRRLAFGAGVLATAAAVTVAGVVTTPWSHGKHAASAYAIEQNADGSLEVTVHFDDLRDPSALNRELAQHNARTVVMARSAPGACKSSILTDPQHRMILRGSSLAEIQAQRRAQSPWLTEPGQPVPGDQLGTAIFTIHPELVPAGDQLLVMYTYQPTRRSNGPAGSDALGFSSLPVLSLPGCVPASEDQVVDGRTGQIHPR